MEFWSSTQHQTIISINMEHLGTWIHEAHQAMQDILIIIDLQIILPISIFINNKILNKQDLVTVMHQMDQKENSVEKLGNNQARKIDLLSWQMCYQGRTHKHSATTIINLWLLTTRQLCRNNFQWLIISCKEATRNRNLLN